MAWFVYRYPFPISQPTSYILIPNNGKPACKEGEYLGAIKAEVLPDTYPAQPDLSDEDFLRRMKKAIRLRKSTGKIRLRPTP